MKNFTSLRKVVGDFYSIPAIAFRTVAARDPFSRTKARRRGSRSQQRGACNLDDEVVV